MTAGHADYYARTTCRLCEGTALETVVELTPTPPGNRVLTADEVARPGPAYPLQLQFCTGCWHVQLGHVVDPNILYREHYTYVTGTSPVFVEHFRTYAREVIERVGLVAGDLVADIGSNDGTGLQFFKDAGMTVLGVDPAGEIAAAATARGIETVPEFFGDELADQLRKVRGPAKLITSHNACAHIDDLAGVVRGVKRWLADDGVFVFEVGYFVDVFSNAWFDTIYHEHLDYHTVHPLPGFFARHGMEVVAVERIAPQGGSIRVYVQNQGGRMKPDGSVDQLIALEHELGLDRPATLRAWNDRLLGIRGELGALLRREKAAGKTIAGFGAPTKSTTLMMHFGIGNDIVDFIVDDNPLKQGRYTPGTHVPIGATDLIYDKKPDYLLILAWNFAPSIMAKHARFAAGGGRFILPMPVPTIVAGTGDA